MRIVLNADDFGMSDDTLRGTIECFERGGLTSATIMPAMPATARAIEFARAHPQFSFGVHLTFTGDCNEHPVTDPRKLPALVTNHGLFQPANTVRRRAIFLRLPIDQIATEIEAQVNSVRDQGVKISHVDSHHHLHQYAPFRAALRRVLPKLGIARVRNVQNIFLRKPAKSSTYWFGLGRRRRLMRSFHTTEHFYMPTSSYENNWQCQLLRRLEQSGDTTLEIGVHPGYVDFWRSDERAGIQRFATEARALGHQLIGWKDV